MSGLIRFAVFLIVITFVFSIATPQCFGQEPAWWTKQKKDCGLPANLAYNSWDGSCPGQSGPTPDNGEAERQRQQQIEAERQRQEAEQKRLEAAKEARRIADLQVFEKNRDEAAGTLKGSSGSPTIKTTTESGLRGSGADTGIKTGKPEKKPELRETEYFYTLQTRKFEPLNDGGHPIDSPEAKPQLGRHALVGGTSWTYGFKWPQKECNKECRAELIARICATGPKEKKCDENTLPFTVDNYDMVVSMASYHNFFADLVTRVVFDGPTLGEFTKQHKEIFASLDGREFDTLDCHSNGAMLCLAALKGGLVKAKVVRLFGPQINPKAAELWKGFIDKGMKVEVYINNGDPVPALSWKLAMTKPKRFARVIPAWVPTIGATIATLPKALNNAQNDVTDQVMDAELFKYGLTVQRSSCSRQITLSCHYMREYESKMK